jgi:hypothetical protein
MNKVGYVLSYAVLPILWSILALTIYGPTALALNVATTLNFDSGKLTVKQAEELIITERQKSILKDKKINLLPLEDNYLLKNGIAGAVYSSNEEFYILMDKDHAYKKPLLHEIGHVILRTPSKEKHTLEEAIALIDNFPKKIGTKDLVSYILSPKEFFCNAYALFHK